MSILDNIKFDTLKEKVSSVKIAIIKIITPLTYLEYSLKLILIIDLKRIKLLEITIYLALLLMLIMGVFFPSLVNTHSIILSLCYNLILFSSIKLYKRKISKKKRNKIYKEDKNKIKFKEIKITKSKLPESLERFKD